MPVRTVPRLSQAHDVPVAAAGSLRIFQVILIDRAAEQFSTGHVGFLSTNVSILERHWLHRSAAGPVDL
jgi:hypothetical protein